MKNVVNKEIQSIRKLFFYSACTKNVVFVFLIWIIKCHLKLLKDQICICRPQDVRERWEMWLCPDGIMAQQTLYSIISLAQLCQGWNLHSGHGRCNWDIGSLIGHRDTNPDWGSNVLSFIQFTFEKESADPPTKFKQLGWGRMVRERREANILQLSWKYFTKNFEAWAPLGKVKSEIIVHKPRMKKVLLGGAEMWNGMWGVKLLTDDILSVSAVEDNRFTAQIFEGN